MKVGIWVEEQHQVENRGIEILKEEECFQALEQPGAAPKAHSLHKSFKFIITFGSIQKSNIKIEDTEI